MPAPPNPYADGSPGPFQFTWPLGVVASKSEVFHEYMQDIDHKVVASICKYGDSCDLAGDLTFQSSTNKLFWVKCESSFSKMNAIVPASHTIDVTTGGIIELEDGATLIVDANGLIRVDGTAGNPGKIELSDHATLRVKSGAIEYVDPGGSIIWGPGPGIALGQFKANAALLADNDSLVQLHGAVDLGDVGGGGSNGILNVGGGSRGIGQILVADDSLAYFNGTSGHNAKLLVGQYGEAILSNPVAYNAAPPFANYLCAPNIPKAYGTITYDPGATPKAQLEPGSYGVESLAMSGDNIVVTLFRAMADAYFSVPVSCTAGVIGASGDIPGAGTGGTSCGGVGVDSRTAAGGAGGHATFHLVPLPSLSITVDGGQLVTGMVTSGSIFATGKIHFAVFGRQ